MQKRILSLLAILVILAIGISVTSGLQATPRSEKSFRRIATFPVINNYCVPQAPNACFDRLTVAEIVAVSQNGTLLIYTDSVNRAVGFVDIKNPEKPAPGGTINVGGAPTSVAVSGRYALIGVDSSPSFVAPSGHLTVIDLVTMTVVPGAEAINLGGQPDSVAISPNGKYAVIVIENERDEDLGDGAPPQLPAGKLVRIEMNPNSHPTAWKFNDIVLAGLPDKFPTDPEPENVDINDDNIAVVSLQENNYFVLIDLKTSAIVNHFSAGTEDLTQIDTLEEDVINFNANLSDVLREPDGVAWISNTLFVSADEGDLDGGSRGFTIFNKNSTIHFKLGSEYEHLGGRIGHYPEGRSENKGVEPEAVEYGTFESENFLFVGSERGSYVGVYRVNNGLPEFAQVLAAGFGPEGLLAIPQQKLFVAANEEDGEDDGISDRTVRASITIFRYEQGGPTYPTIESDMDASGAPIGSIRELELRKLLPNAKITAKVKPIRRWYTVSRPN